MWLRLFRRHEANVVLGSRRLLNFMLEVMQRGGLHEPRFTRKVQTGPRAGCWSDPKATRIARGSGRIEFGISFRNQVVRQSKTRKCGEPMRPGL